MTVRRAPLKSTPAHACLSVPWATTRMTIDSVSPAMPTANLVEVHWRRNVTCQSLSDCYFPFRFALFPLACSALARMLRELQLNDSNGWVLLSSLGVRTF